MYVAAVLVLRPAVGDSILMAVTVPALVAAWSLGARAALLASLVAFLLNVLLVTAGGEEGEASWATSGGALGGVTLAGAALVVGHLRDIRARLEREAVERGRGQAAHRLLAEIATNMAEGVYLTRTSDGVIVYANERV